MFTLKLVKAKSYTGTVHATEKNPIVAVKTQAEADALVQSGYFSLVRESKATEAVSNPVNVPLEKMTVAQLQTYAKERSIDLGVATRKDDILAAIKVAESDTNDDNANGSGENGGNDTPEV